MRSAHGSESTRTPESGVERLLRWATLAIIGYGIVLRCIFPTADPLHATWSGWMLDEGRWTELAREWSLFRAPDFDTGVSTIHVLIAPVYQLLTAMSFELFGVGPGSARLVSRVAGIVVIALMAFSLRRSLVRPAWCVVLVITALNPELVYASRVAIPEMAALCIATFAFFLLTGGPRNVRRAALAGLVTAIALATKATTLPIVLPFAAIVWFMHRTDDPASRIARLGGFLGGLAAPALVLFPFLLVTGKLSNLVSADGGVLVILRFVQAASPFGAVWKLFHSGDASNVMLQLALLWPLTIAVWVRGIPDTDAGMLLRSSLAWLAGWLVPWLTLEYFPERYLVHLHVPLALAIGAGLSVLASPAQRSLHDALSARPASYRWLVGVASVLPLAVILAPVFAAGLSAAGVAADRVRVLFALVAALAAVCGTWRARPGHVPLGFTTVLFPLCAALIWRLAHGPFTGSYWTVTGSGELLYRLGGLAAALAAAAVLAAASRRVASQARLSYWCAIGVAALVVVLSVANVAPTLRTRSYTMLAIGDYLTRRYAHTTIIGSNRAASLLLGSRFRYHEAFDASPTPDVMLVGIWESTTNDEAHLYSYAVVKEFVIPPLRYRDVVGAGARVLLYERTATGPLRP